MPIVTFHLAEDAVSAEQCARLMREASEAYARILESPIERVRTFIQLYPAAQQSVAGGQVSSGDKGAPLFEYLVLKGRPQAQRFELMRTFTDQVATILGIEPKLVRGRCIQLDPEDWGIGGLPASELRKQEIEQREQGVHS